MDGFFIIFKKVYGNFRVSVNRNLGGDSLQRRSSHKMRGCSCRLDCPESTGYRSVADGNCRALHQAGSAIRFSLGRGNSLGGDDCGWVVPSYGEEGDGAPSSVLKSLLFFYGLQFA